MLTLALLVAALTTSGPTPQPSITPAPQAWHPIPHTTEPPESPEKIAHDLLELRITTSNLVYGILSPYCVKYGGIVSILPASESNPYPLQIQCVNKNLTINKVILPPL